MRFSSPSAFPTFTIVWASLAIECPSTKRLLYEVADTKKVALPTTAVFHGETAAEAAARHATESLKIATPAWALKPAAVCSTMHGGDVHHIHICHVRDSDFAANSGGITKSHLLYLTPEKHMWLPFPDACELSLEDFLLVSQLREKGY